MSEQRLGGAAQAGRRSGSTQDSRLLRLVHLTAYFPELAGLVRPRSRPSDVVLSTIEPGEKRRAKAVAVRRGAEHWLVQDGLIRSVGEPASGAVPISLIADQVAGPSRLAALLGTTDWETPELLAEARELIAFKRAEGLSRINNGVPLAANNDGAPTVLVIDLTAGEPWLGQQPASPQAYDAMLDAARRDHPAARIVVRCERRDTPLAARADVVIDASIDVMSAIEQADAVYVVDSLIGLDALLCGKPVTVFGQPFYAGLGLTDDRQPPESRRTTRSMEGLFAAAYMLYPRYVDPLSGEPCDAKVGFRRLAAFKRHARRVRGRWVGLNIPAAKQPVLKAFLAGPQSSFALFGRLGGDRETRYANWASWASAATRRARASWPERVTNIEDGFVRSVGLGSSFHPASSLVLDSRGIYYDPRTPSDLEHCLNSVDFAPHVLEEAQRLRRAIVDLGLSKYNLQVRPTLALEHVGDRLKILVPGQVEDDASVLAGGEACSNLELLRRVRQAEPAAFIVYKEHPDVTAGNRRGKVSGGDAEKLADLMVRDIDIIACVEAVDQVHTLTSLTGFEAMLRGKPVVTYGWPFYAGWGLTLDRAGSGGPSRRTISLDALVAGALMTYPLYLDPISWLPCDAAAFVDRIRVLRSTGSVSTQRPKGRIMRLEQAARTLLFPPRPPAY